MDLKKKVILFTVSKDNGIGIEKEYFNKIFELFYRLDPTKTREEGIGLSLIKKILFRLNGKVWIDSAMGKGSKFYISLPADSI